MKNFMQIPPRGASRQMDEIYAKIFSSCTYTFFSETHLQVRPFGRFLRAMAQTTRSRARMCLLGVKKLKLIFNVFIRKNRKKLQWRIWGKLSNYLNGHNFGCV